MGPPPPDRRRALRGWLLLALVVGGCGRPEPEVKPALPEGLELPRPDLSGFEAVVRQRVESLQAAVEARWAEAKTQPGGDAEALGDAFGELGNHYHAFLFLGAAETCYAQAAELAPGRFRWHYYLGTVLAHQGEDEAAVEAFERARDLGSEDLAVHVRLGDLYLRLDRAPEARASFTRAAEIDPTNPAATFGLGRAAALAGEDEEAVRWFERTLELQPTAATVHYPLAQAYRRLGDPEKARLHLDLRGEGGIGFADPLMQQILRLELLTAVDSIRSLASQPERLSDEELVNFAAAQLGETEGALEVFRGSVERDGAGGTPYQQARVLFVLGTLEGRQGDSAAAVRHLEAALSLVPELTAARLPLARALRRGGRGEEALSMIDRLLAADPGDLRTRLERAEVLGDLGREGEAIAELRRAVAAAPDHGEAHLRLGVALEARGELAAAAAQLEEATSLELPRQDRALAYHRLGEMLRRRGKPGEAEQRYLQALEEDPSLLDARLGLAAAMGQGRRFEEAVGVYRQVLAEHPGNLTAHLGEATALLLLGRNREARELLEAGLEAMPSELALLRLLARHLAACPDRSIRDGPRALELASEVMRQQPSLEDAETLAMALAESGRFEEAVRTQERLLERAQAAGEQALRARLAANLERYREGRSCCAGGA